MGREVRMVPANWEHPKDHKGNYVPLLDGSFSQDVKRWDEEAEMWAKGKRREYGTEGWIDIEDEYKDIPFEEWDGERPEEKDYMPDWDASECTHYMMYENTSEGTPISPALETPEELARWLTDNNASAFGNDTATYEQWLRVCRGGYAPSAVYTPGTGLISGVAGLGIGENGP